MAISDESGGVSALVRHTAGMAELAIHAGHPDRKHYEYLPYPDNNFYEPVDDRFQRAGKFTAEHIFSRSGKAFIPNVPVHVQSIVAERIYTGFTEFLNPYLYCVTTKHGSFEWTIYKRYRHFHDLHKALVQFFESEARRTISEVQNLLVFNQPCRSIPRSRSIKFLAHQSINDEDNENPCFPTRNDRTAFINDTLVRERCTILSEYLNKVLKHPKFRSHPAMHEFLDVSCISFVHGLSTSRKEGYLLKRSLDDYRGQHTFFRLPFFCDLCKFHHGQKWLVIKDSYITYIRPDSHEVRFPMLLDRGFDVLTGLRNAGTYHGIKIRNLQRTLYVKCRSKRDFDEWIHHLHQLMEQSKGFISATASRFNSYAPVREKQLAYWFINGKSYMQAVAKALLTAKEEVFITDWWLSPEIMMIRPSDDETYRLDLILAQIAEQGVRVYVMIYKEMSIAFGLNSLYTKRVLKSKNKKGFIKVLRHPNHYPKGGVLFWSHHEKTVVIDQKIAFVGGIDLCYGRWDDEFMRLVDLGEENDRTLKMPSQIAAEEAAAGGTHTVETSEKATVEMAEDAGEMPSKKLPLLKQWSALSDHQKASDQMRTAASAPHKASEDIQLARRSSGTGHQMKSVAQKWIQSKLAGSDGSGNDSDSADDEAEATNDKAYREDEEITRRPERYANRWIKLAQKMRKSNADDSDEEEKLENLDSPAETLPVMDRKHRYFVGKDYSNAYEKDFETLDRYSEDYIDRKAVPRMPWHDEALVVFGQAARDVARHFIQRWNIHKCEKYLSNSFYPFLLPKSYEDDDDLTVKNWRAFLDSRPFKVNAQCVRSVGPWSIGTKTIESSIQNAYIQMMDAAQYFIYIENQFFITIAQDSQVRNYLADTLFRRIERAHNCPAFIMRSISKGDASLFKRLEKAGIPPTDYISFFGMRGHDVLMGRLVTEIIYVHSKLMIIDDRMAICGSANINDRSLLGQRDSELCIVINDREEEEVTFDNKTVRVGKFCSSWRRRLFQMMLGIQHENPKNIDVSDPVSDQFYNYFRDVAKKNALIYEEVFATLPSDRVRKFADVAPYTDVPKMKDTDPIQAYEKLKGIQGLIVEYPLYFLDEENYLPGFQTREGIVPNVTWT